MTEPIEGAEDPSVTTVEEPEEVTEPQIESTGSSLAGNIPGWLVGVIVLATLASYAFVIRAAWSYVTTHDETAEDEDWTQLLGLIDMVDTLVLFLLGAVFGVAVQQRQTAAARSAARKNEDEARKQHQKATAGAEKTAHNREAAKLQDARATRAVSELRKATRRLNDFEHDASGVVIPRAALQEVDVQGSDFERRLGKGMRRMNMAYLVPGNELATTAPQLQTLAEELAEAADELDGQRLSL